MTESDRPDAEVGRTSQATDTNQPDRPSAAINISEVLVQLRFDLGSLRIPVSDLESLQPGYIFTLDATIDSPVAITIGNYLVGRGELVCIGDRVGVRLLEITPNAHKHA